MHSSGQNNNSDVGQPSAVHMERRFVKPHTHTFYVVIVALVILNARCIARYFSVTPHAIGISECIYHPQKKNQPNN